MNPHHLSNFKEVIQLILKNNKKISLDTTVFIQELSSSWISFIKERRKSFTEAEQNTILSELNKKAVDDSILFPSDPEKYNVKSTSMLSPRPSDSSLDPSSIMIELTDGQINRRNNFDS